MGNLEKTEVRLEVSEDAKKLWEVISGIGAVDRWFSGLIRACRVEGKGVGAKRHCMMSDGTKLDEEIVELNHERMAFAYTIADNPNLPATRVRGAITLKRLGLDRTEFVWSAEYLPREGMPGAMRKMLEDVYPMGIRSLESYCRAN